MRIMSFPIRRLSPPGMKKKSCVSQLASSLPFLWPEIKMSKQDPVNNEMSSVDAEKAHKKKRKADASLAAASLEEAHHPPKKHRKSDDASKKDKKKKRDETDEERKARKQRKREKKSRNEQADVDKQPDSSSISLPPASSSVYVENAKLTGLPQADISKFLDSNAITISNKQSPDRRPITAFEYLPETSLTAHDIFKSFTAPTPIQAAAWPYAFDGRDVVGVAETGSGKTLAFGLPCARLLQAQGAKKGKNAKVQALVVSPTRELALQINDQFSKLARDGGLKSACVYGGIPKDEQRKSLSGANVLIATPGRLNDFVEEGTIDLSGVLFAVLDEADRMLDKGFEEDIKRILSKIPTPRQVLMFTATWPQSIRELAATFMTNPVKITIGGDGTGELRASANIKQLVEVVDPRHKQTRLLQLLQEHTRGSKKNDRILVFALYKKEADRVEGFIRAKGFRVAGIHGDMAQSAREKSLDAFKTGKTPILVATDVAARGIDIPSVALVLNNTFPLTAEDYVHRIGRTGRAGQKGLAITLFTEQDKGLSGA